MKNQRAKIEGKWDEFGRFAVISVECFNGEVSEYSMNVDDFFALKREVDGLADTHRLVSASKSGWGGKPAMKIGGSG